MCSFEYRSHEKTWTFHSRKCTIVYFSVSLLLWNHFSFYWTNMKFVISIAIGVCCHYYLHSSQANFALYQFKCANKRKTLLVKVFKYSLQPFLIHIKQKLFDLYFHWIWNGFYTSILLNTRQHFQTLNPNIFKWQCIALHSTEADFEMLFSML